ncbi:MAG: ATP-grasp domain-containing protein, partial [Candidatus Margulisbacteria bacterium]|nr:ATP-grasp domain-containing protein [Candidatus Margulisiibacteriota bacterium]
IAEGYCGRSREAHIPALLEMLHVPHSGPDPFTAALSLDKISAKKLAAYAGATTPAHYVVLPDKEINLQVVRFPVIVKPAYEGSSIGIRQDSKVFNLPELEKKITWLRANYPSQPVIIEQFISGREFTVGITGNNTPKVLGVMEIVPIKKALKDFIYSLEVKRNYLEEVEYICPPNLSEAMMQELTRVAIHLFNNFGCRDIARFDFRIDDYGTPYFLEVNTLPGLHPVSSDIVIMARAMGIEYDQLIKKIFNTAFARYN